jgi:hypothetical protein
MNYQIWQMFVTKPPKTNDEREVREILLFRTFPADNKLDVSACTLLVNPESS